MDPRARLLILLASRLAAPLTEVALAILNRPVLVGLDDATE